MKLIIPEMIYKKIMYLTRKTDHEVSGIGMVEMNEEGNLYVSEIEWVDQDARPTETQVTGGREADYWHKIFETDPVAYFHWHSHPTFGVSPSGTDDELYEGKAQEMPCIGLIVNQKGDYSAHLAEPVETISGREIMYTKNIACEVDDGLSAELKEQWDKEFDKHVNIITYKNIVATSDKPIFPIAGRQRYEHYLDDSEYVWHEHYGYIQKSFLSKEELKEYK